MDPLSPLKRIVPAGLKRDIKEWLRRRRFRRAVREFCDHPDGQEYPRELLERLVAAWGNAGWSVQHEYMQAMLHHARRAQGPILECGSGLSTVLMALITRETDTLIRSLEHTPRWAERVRAELASLGLAHAEVVDAPLQERGEYQWYGAAAGALPEGIALVLCDGPPSDTRGGRYGLLPEVHERLAAGCVVLVDDMERADEQAMVERWQREFGGDCQVFGEDKPYAEYRPGGG